MMHVRCKLQLQEIHTLMYGKKYVFRACYDETIEEDRRFCKYSPNGTFEITVDNPAVNYEVGALYYFDSHPCPVPAAAAT
jgi:hypothetical protein